jgi:peroxiredoxin
MTELPPTPIADAVSAFPAVAENAFSREQAALRATTPPVASPGVGFPDPELIAADGTATSITTAREGRPAVVVLYRGEWCPFCNVALRTYRNELRTPLIERGVQLIAVSPQAPDGSLTMQEKHDLDFPVLSDPGNRIARALGILTRPTDDARALQLQHGLDLAEINADGTAELPMPTVAIIAADGTLAWIDVHPDYSTRTEPAEVLGAIRELGL